MVEGLHVDARHIDVLDVHLLDAIRDVIAIVVGVSNVWNDIDRWKSGRGALQLLMMVGG